MEDKIVATVRMLQTDDDLLAMREALDRELKPYRGKMTAEQLAMLERRYLDTALLERARLPRSEPLLFALTLIQLRTVEVATPKPKPLHWVALGFARDFRLHQLRGPRQLRRRRQKHRIGTALQPK